MQRFRRRREQHATAAALWRLLQDCSAPTCSRTYSFPQALLGPWKRDPACSLGYALSPPATQDLVTKGYHRFRVQLLGGGE